MMDPKEVARVLSVTIRAEEMDRNEAGRIALTSFALTLANRMKLKDASFDTDTFISDCGLAKHLDVFHRFNRGEEI